MSDSPSTAQPAETSLAHRHFSAHWTHGHTTKPVTRTGRMSELRALAHYIRPHRRLALLAWGGALFRAVLLCFVPIVTKQAIDNGIAKSDGEYLVVMCILGVVVITLAWTGIVARSGFGWQLGDRVTIELQTELFAHFQTLSRYQIEQIGAGTIISRVINDAPSIRNLFQLGVVAALRNSAQIIVSLIFMLLLDVDLTLISLLVVPLMFLATWSYKRKVRPLYAETRATLADVTTNAHNSFDVMRLVHTYSQEDQQAKIFHESNVNNRQSQVKPNIYLSIFNPATTVISSISAALLIVVGGIQAVDGAIEVGTIVAFIGLVSTFFGSLVGLSGTASTYAQGMAAVDQCFNFLAIKTEIDEPANPTHMPPGVQEIAVRGFTHVNRYSNAETNPASIDIHAGQHVAFVGDIGSGRSVASRVIARLVAPSRGSVTYGGIDISQLGLREYHDRVRYVAPTPFLFSGTIAENLRLAKPDVSDDEIRDALSRIGGDGFIETFANGIDTEVSAGGNNLSSGQLALLGVIRGLFTVPDVFIMDGCLDRFPLSIIHDVFERITQFAPNASIIVTTQRYEIAREAAYVYYFMEGDVVEQGEYSTLIEENGKFAELVTSARTNNVGLLRDIDFTG